MHPVLAKVIKRAGVLFAASIGILIAACGAMWWHYTRTERHFCAIDSDEPVLCYRTTWYFGPSVGELLALLLLYFAFCCGVVWLCIWVRNKRSTGPGEA